MKGSTGRTPIVLQLEAMAMSNAERAQRFRERKAAAEGRELGKAGRQRTAKHGSPTEYKNGCRCELCTKAQTARMAEYRARRAAGA